MPPGLRQHYQYFTEAPMDKLRAAGYTRTFRSVEEAVADYVPWLSTNVPAPDPR